jgi:hypothetical protein
VCKSGNSVMVGGDWHCQSNWELGYPSSPNQLQFYIQSARLNESYQWDMETPVCLWDCCVAVHTREWCLHRCLGDVSWQLGRNPRRMYCYAASRLPCVCGLLCALADESAAEAGENLSAITSVAFLDCPFWGFSVSGSTALQTS